MLAYNDHFRLTGNYKGRADIYSTDVARPGDPTLIASEAEAEFFLNPNRTKLVYSVTQSSDSGIYVYALP